MQTPIKRMFAVIVTIFIAGFILFFCFHQKNSYHKAHDQLKHHALVVANSLWRYETEEPVAYLRLAAQSDGYKKLVITDDCGDEFVSIKRPQPKNFELLLEALGLLPLNQLEADIIYKNAIIGKITVEWENRAVFTYFYILICIFLSLPGIWFFLSLIEAKRTLEARVVERTSDLKESQDRLKLLGNYLSNIINSMPSVLVGVDPDGKITQWNIKAEHVTGIISKAAVGQKIETAYPQLTNEMDQVRKAILTRKEQRSKKQVHIQGNEQRYEDVTVYPLIANGVEGAVIRIDDVTEQVRLEEMMVQSEKMLSVGGLAAGMAHEINNPLAGMMQTANVMKTRLENMTMPANLCAAKEAGVTMEGIRAFMEARGILRMANVINESGGRLAKIVENMLSFARKADAGVSSHDPIQLMDTILELAAADYDLKKQYDFKNIKIVKEYKENLPMLPCQSSKIQQVFLNILRNGAQAMLKAKKDTNNQPCFILRMFLEEQTGMLTIEVEDNGPGMDEAVCKRVFEPFFTTKPPGIGTGLGLSVSYFIITQNHGGTMGVESLPGKGTTFVIRLPLEQKR